MRLWTAGMEVSPYFRGIFRPFRRCLVACTAPKVAQKLCFQDPFGLFRPQRLLWPTIACFAGSKSTKFGICLIDLNRLHKE